MSDERKGLILENSLQAFFYDQLKNLNDKSTKPLPNEVIYHSSLVMDNFGESLNYFEKTTEGLRDKVLGIKLLEATDLPAKQQRRKVREIADTALFRCGYFSESVNSMIIDINYYHEIGRAAYRKLNSLVPKAYDIPDFYRQFSASFHLMTNMMGIISKSYKEDHLDKSILFINKSKETA